MPNPSGSNMFIKQPAYGDIKKLTELTKSAPMSGAPTPAINAPKAAQRKAVKGGGARPQGSSSPPVAAAPPQSNVPYEARLAMMWRDIAAEVDDPLVKYYAGLAEAQASKVG